MQHPHDGTAVQVAEAKQWPSVARCTAGQVSTDSFPCDHNNTMQHPHDGTAVQVAEAKQWPSVARCTAGQVSTDSFPCDHNNTMQHPHDGTAIQTVAEARPKIKCVDPVHGNPITCDWDDIDTKNGQALPKDALGFTPQKVIEGGPNVVGPLQQLVNKMNNDNAKGKK